MAWGDFMRDFYQSLAPGGAPGAPKPPPPGMPGVMGGGSSGAPGSPYAGMGFAAPGGMPENLTRNPAAMSPGAGAPPSPAIAMGTSGVTDPYTALQQGYGGPPQFSGPATATGPYGVNTESMARMAQQAQKARRTGAPAVSSVPRTPPPSSTEPAAAAPPAEPGAQVSAFGGVGGPGGGKPAAATDAAGLTPEERAFAQRADAINRDYELGLGGGRQELREIGDIQEGAGNIGRGRSARGGGVVNNLTRALAIGGEGYFRGQASKRLKKMGEQEKQLREEAKGKYVDLDRERFGGGGGWGSGGTSVGDF